MDEKIRLAHGNGGKLMGDLLDQLILKILGGKTGTVQGDDAAILPVPSTELVFTTDSYTVSPLFFPGGDIGKLAVCGTVNDLAVMGARPAYLSCSLIIEEGFLLSDLKKILTSMARTARRTGLAITTGDTKVVEKNQADGLFINTAGIGFLTGRMLRQPVSPGDQVLINGSIGDHGIAIMARRNDLSAGSGLASDCAPLFELIDSVADGFSGAIKFLRDATRGGVVSVLHEVIKGGRLGVRLEEDQLPFKKQVLAVCDLLGIDPLYAANEGKAIMIVAPDQAPAILQKLKAHPLGRKAAVIGEITDRYPGQVYLTTSLGGSRVLPEAIDIQLPRIC